MQLSDCVQLHVFHCWPVGYTFSSITNSVYLRISVIERQRMNNSRDRNCEEPIPSILNLFYFETDYMFIILSRDQIRVTTKPLAPTRFTTTL